MANKQTTEERFDERFGVIQKYHPSYWGAPDKDGTQIAVPSKITEESENIKSFINSEKALAIAEERKRIVEEVKKRSSYFKRVVSEWGDTYTDTVKGITEEDLLSLISKDNLQDKEN